VIRHLNPNIKPILSIKIPAHWEVERLKNIAKMDSENLSEIIDPDYVIQSIDITSVEDVRGINPPVEMTFEDAPSRRLKPLKIGGP